MAVVQNAKLVITTKLSTTDRPSILEQDVHKNSIAMFIN